MPPLLPLQVNEQVVELSVGLGFEAAPKPIPELIGVEAASHVLPAEVPPRPHSGQRPQPQVPIGRRSPRIVVDLLGHVVLCHPPTEQPLTI